MNNKKAGTAFEKEFCSKLAEHGFWVHRFQDNKNGQPFDIIAAKNMKTLVFDCKDCTTETFVLSRIEDNQKLAMKAWQKAGNLYAMFAIKMNEKIYIVLYDSLMNMIEAGKKQVSEEEIKAMGNLFEPWIAKIR